MMVKPFTSSRGLSKTAQIQQFFGLFWDGMPIFRGHGVLPVGTAVRRE
jgi:hypothetical protein